MTHYCREVKTRRNISDQLTQTSDNHLNTTTPPKCATVAGHMTNQKIFDNKMPKAPGKDMEWASVAGMGFQLTLVRAAGGSGCWWVGLVGSGDLSATTTHRPPVRSRFLAPPPPPPLPPPPPFFSLLVHTNTPTKIACLRCCDAVMHMLHLCRLVYPSNSLCNILNDVNFEFIIKVQLQNLYF